MSYLNIKILNYDIYNLMKFIKNHVWGKITVLHHFKQ